MNYGEFLKELQQGRIMPCYLFFGRERFLIRQTLETFKSKFLPIGLEEFNMETINWQHERAAAVINAAQTLPMLGEKRLVIVENCSLFASGKKEDAVADSDRLLEYLEDTNPGCLLVFLSGEKIDKRKKLTRKIERLGGLVEFEALTGTALIKWIKEQFAREEKRLDNEALEFLVTTVDNDLELLSNEIDKICTFLGPEEIVTLSDVKQLVGNSVQAGIFEMVDAIGEKKVSLALGLLRDMLSRGEPAVKIAYMIARQIRLILEAKVFSAAGAVGGSLAARMEVHPFVAKKALRQSQNFKQQELIRALEKMLELDIALKSSTGDAATIMELTIMDLVR